jgi:hypothetical protein
MTNKPSNNGAKPKRLPKSKRIHTRRLKQVASKATGSAT